MSRRGCWLARPTDFRFVFEFWAVGCVVIVNSGTHWQASYLKGPSLINNFLMHFPRIYFGVLF
jgi:hypothetical protein